MYDANPGLQGGKGGHETTVEGEDQESKGLAQYARESRAHVGTYFAQSCWAPGFCLSMLYFTVLSFGILMTDIIKKR